MSAGISGFLEISTADVESRQGGGAFRDFMKRLIEAHMLSVKIPATDFVSDGKNMRDGGCDGEVRSGSPTDPDNHLDVPTVWQFKATKARYSSAELEEEINKAHVRQRIVDGYRFVFAIAADMPANKAADW